MTKRELTKYLSLDAVRGVIFERLVKLFLKEHSAELYAEVRSPSNSASIPFKTFTLRETVTTPPCQIAMFYVGYKLTVSFTVGRLKYGTKTF